MAMTKSSKKGTRTKMGKALAVRQTGATFAGKMGKSKVYRLGGGLFTTSELVKSRVRLGKSWGIR